MITEFTPYSALLGGVLIGASSVLLMASLGRIAGISGILSSVLPPISSKQNLVTGIAFVIGLLSAMPIYKLVTGIEPVQSITDNYILLAIAGIVVGIGTVLGNGCTSGHGVCGISRFSIRSMIATLTFMIVAIITVFLSRHVVGV